MLSNNWKALRDPLQNVSKLTVTIDRLFGGGVRVHDGNVRVERVPTVAAVVVRDAHQRDDRDRGRRRERRSGRRRERRRPGGEARGGDEVLADVHGVPDVPGVRGP